MLDKKWFSISSKIYLVVAFVGFIALWFSPFVVSLATVISGLLLISHLKSFTALADSRLKLLITSVVVLSLIALLDGVVSGFSSASGSKIGLLLGFLFCFLAGLHFLKSNKIDLVNYALMLCVAVVVVNVLAITNYFQHKEEIDALLLQSKSIPIPNMHHIHFGIINAIAAILLFGILLMELIDTKQRRLALVLVVIIFISAHILSSRTGLLSLYVSISLGALYYAFSSKNYKPVVFAIIGLMVFSLGAYTLSDSLRNKISNSLEDINSWGQDEEINHKSMAMRIEAYKASSHIVIKHPIGVGANRLDAEMQNSYSALNSPLWEENRIGPHNQLLEFGVKYGWIGIGSIILFLISLFRIGGESSYIYFAFCILVLVSFQFESLLERQASLYFLAVFIPLFIRLFTPRLGTNNLSSTKNVL